MKPGFILLSLVWAVACAQSQPVTLVSTLTDRPVFNVGTNLGVLTRTVAPGSRLSVEPGWFSGLGDKRVPLSGGVTYYMARLGSTARLYQLTTGQVLILNQAGQPVEVALSSGSAVLAAGCFALASVDSGALEVSWTASGVSAKAQLTRAGVYRLQLDSAGLGTEVSLSPWD